jgi:hypothetical protein
VFTVWVPKAAVVDERDTPAPATPVPESETVWGEPVALSVRVMAAALAPVVVGAKLTLTLQLALAARLALHPLLMANSAESVPPSTMLEMLTDDVPVLVIVTACDALLVLTSWFPKARVVEERVMVLPVAAVTVTVTALEVDEG